MTWDVYKTLFRFGWKKSPTKFKTVQKSFFSLKMFNKAINFYFGSIFYDFVNRKLCWLVLLIKRKIKNIRNIFLPHNYKTKSINITYNVGSSSKIND